MAHRLPPRVSAALLACCGPLAGCTLLGDGWAWSHDNAPFRIGKIRSALFASDGEPRDRGGDGILLLSNEKLECRDLESFDGDESSAEDLFAGRGLLFVIDVWQREGFDDPDDWAGLYMQGYSYGFGAGAERSMYAAAWQDGELFTLGSAYGGGEPAWVDVERKGDHFKGEFDTAFWRGSYKADLCDPIDGGGGTYYYDWYDDTGDWR